MAKFNPFNIIKQDVLDSNQFDLSFDNKLTLDMGNLYPVLVQETLPGDKFTITPEMLIRLQPMTFPIMHRIDATIHFFYVPNRILWKNWKKFIAGENFVPLFVQGTDLAPWVVTAGSFWDYMGMPISSNIKERVSFLPSLAYFKIYNEYYQDQNNDSNYTASRDLLEEYYETAGGDVTAISGAALGDYELHQRAWEHDYFTSALPWAQKGSAVNIPLTLSDLEVEITNGKKLDGTNLPVKDLIGADGTNSGLLYQQGTPDTATMLTGLALGDSAVLEGTINQLRSAMQLQKFLELQARTGTRYNELIMAHFSTDVGDSRINRPEYIGGIKNNVVISEVLQTSATTETTALGEYAGHGTAVVSGEPISYYCPEHGHIIGVLSVMPKTAYFQGINRKFTRMTYLDYYWSHFAHIGEQAILNKELYYDSSLSSMDDTFGYIPRYSEYKYNPSEVHGDMRTTMLDFHLARNFSSAPTLSDAFIYCDSTQTDRIFAVQAEGTDSLYAHIYFDIKANRKIPFFTNPGGL